MPIADLFALPAVARLTREPGVYAVGGAVRDVLVGRAPPEVDLVVEGDAIALANRLGGTVTAHERFGTATVRLEGGVVLDLASARRETYVRPGALPDVELGATIDEDLWRRDFTVNAIAVRLADGATSVVPGAMTDLSARTLRVLHDGSFLDDPTRMVRMARYTARLGFTPDPATFALAEEAVASGASETVTPPRMGSELRLLLREPQPDGLAALDSIGDLAERLVPSFAFDAGTIARAVELCPPEGRPDIAALAAACRPVATLGARLRELGFSGRDADAVERAAGVEDITSSLEAAAVAAARGSEPATRWLREGRHLRLAITGDDLLEAGLRGPAGDGEADARAAGDAGDQGGAACERGHGAHAASTSASVASGACASASSPAAATAPA